jgi:hypothetical protein
MLTLDMLKRAVEAQADGTARLEVERALLYGAWQEVRPAKDWAPINKTLDTQLCDYSADVIARAVAYFTGTPGEITTLGGTKFLVQSIGRAGPCGP